MRKLLILSMIMMFITTSMIAQSSDSNLPFKFVKKEIKGFLKLKPEQLPKSAYNKGLSLCKKYDYTEDNDLTVSQSNEGKILYRFTSKNNEETAIITDDKGKMIEVIIYLNEELKPYTKITDIAAEKEYDVYPNHGEYGAAVKYITPNESWIELVAKKKEDGKSPVYILFFSDSLKFLREEEKE